MQSQEDMYSNQEHVSQSERAINTDPHEQSQRPETPPIYSNPEHPYADGYSDQFSPPQEGEKLRPLADEQHGMRNVLFMLAAICLAIIISTMLGFLIHWLAWIVLSGLIFVAAFIIISNWRVTTIPLPVETFQVQEHAQLIVNNATGTISIHRGEQNLITVAPTKRVTGLWMSLDNMRINYQQQGDIITTTGKIQWFPFQLGLKNIDLDITVPQSCTLQIKNGSGRLSIQEINGEVSARTGSGSITANALQGQITLFSGSGSINASQLGGRITLNTGSGSMTVSQLNGAMALKTGSGSISATTITGRANFTTGSGRIEVIKSTLSEETKLKTGSGSISFSGALDPLGNYDLLTGSGRINLTLAAQTIFSLHASTGSGKVTNEFNNNEVGAAPRAKLVAKTGSGSITIRRGF